MNDNNLITDNIYDKPRSDQDLVGFFYFLISSGDRELRYLFVKSNQYRIFDGDIVYFHAVDDNDRCEVLTIHDEYIINQDVYKLIRGLLKLYDTIYIKSEFFNSRIRRKWTQSNYDYTFDKQPDYFIIRKITKQHERI